MNEEEKEEKDQHNHRLKPPPTFWEKCKSFFYYPIRLFCDTRKRYNTTYPLDI